MSLSEGLPIYASCLIGGAVVGAALGALSGHFIAQLIIK